MPGDVPTSCQSALYRRRRPGESSPARSTIFLPAGAARRSVPCSSPDATRAPRAATAEPRSGSVFGCVAHVPVHADGPETDDNSVAPGRPPYARDRGLAASQGQTDFPAAPTYLVIRPNLIPLLLGEVRVSHSNTCSFRREREVSAPHPISSYRRCTSR